MFLIVVFGFLFYFIFLISFQSWKDSLKVMKCYAMFENMDFAYFWL